MKIVLNLQKVKPGSWATRIALILTGIFLTTMLYAILVNTLDTIGVWLGLLLGILMSFTGLRYTQKGSHLRILTWGAVGTTIAVVILYVVIVTLLTRSLEF